MTGVLHPCWTDGVLPTIRIAELPFLLVPKLLLGNGVLKLQIPEERPSRSWRDKGFPSRSLGTSQTTFGKLFLTKSVGVTNSHNRKSCANLSHLRRCMADCALAYERTDLCPSGCRVSSVMAGLSVLAGGLSPGADGSIDRQRLALAVAWVRFPALGPYRLAWPSLAMVGVLERIAIWGRLF